MAFCLTYVSVWISYRLIVDILLKNKGLQFFSG